MGCIVDLSIQSTRIVFLIFEIPSASYRDSRPFFLGNNPKEGLGLGTRLTQGGQSKALIFVETITE
jgi:hypothetical protein